MAVLCRNIKWILYGVSFFIFLNGYAGAADIDVLVSGLLGGSEIRDAVTIIENEKNGMSTLGENGRYENLFKDYDVASGKNNDDYFDIKVDIHPQNKVCHVSLGSYTAKDEQTAGPAIGKNENGEVTHVHQLPMVICRDKEAASPQGNFSAYLNREGNFAENGTIENVERKLYYRDTARGKNYYVYYPSGMPQNLKLPLVVLGNGATTVMSEYEKAIYILASKGFIVIGCEGAPELPLRFNWWTWKWEENPVFIVGEDLEIAYTQFKNSEWIDKVDMDNIGIVGISLGGGGGYQLMMDHPEIKTAVLLDPCYPLEDKGMLPPGASRSMLIIDNDTEEGYCPASEVQMLYNAAKNTISVAEIEVPGIYSHIGAILSGLYHTVAWLELQLMGNDSAKSIFYGGRECELHTKAPEKWVYIDGDLRQ